MNGDKAVYKRIKSANSSGFLIRERLSLTGLLRTYEYPYEFWHYSSGDAYEQCLCGSDRPVSYGAVDYDAATGRVTPIEEPNKPLNSLEDIQAVIKAALDRHRGACVTK
jgi:hypothetical protein